MTENSPYLALYPNGKHEEILLGKMLNKGGAAGKIFEVENQPKMVAKIFHSKEKSESNRKKLEAMLHNKPNIPTISNEGTEYIQIAWPIALLEDKQGYCMGYLMPLIDTKEAVSLDHLIQKAVRRKLGLSERYIDRIFAAYNITSVVAALHACGHYIIDLKPANVSIYKKTMLVAMFDCDGFSIKGENNARYPAEYVSEEYIYPEGMSETCENMGEEQDKFALAVIIFKLLNEGIHPFSGTPRNKKDLMLSLQERIANYHYAYGIWPDTYQAPHPYSIHDYFDKTTMTLFERAFTKGNERPSALEWQSQLEYILKHLKQCKKDPNHVYFTPKGCGLCMVNEKLKANLNNIKKQKEEPKTIRGLDISTLTTEKITEQHKKQEKTKYIINQSYHIFLAVYLLFFTFLFKIISPFTAFLKNIGVFMQLILILFAAAGIKQLLALIPQYLPETKNQNILSMLQIYAFICLGIAFLSLNDFSFNLFKLAQ